jgi:hypothetical protein
MFLSRTQWRLLSHLIKVRPFYARRHSPRLGGLALHCALPSYGRCTISNASKEGSNTPAPVTQAWEHKSLIEVSQNKLESIDQNQEADPTVVFPSTIDSCEPFLDLPNRERPPTDIKEAMEASYHNISEEFESSHPWLYVKPGAPCGFVVYRAVYGKESDELFKRLLDLLQDTVSEFLLPNDLRKPVKSDSHFELTVMEDEGRFADADSHTIRAAFREWVADDLPPRVRYPDREGGIDHIKAMMRSTIREPHEYIMNEEPLHPWWEAPPRWCFCLLVDDICLRSLNRPDGHGAVVKIVNLRYHKGRCESIEEGWEDGETDDLSEDVGWMYVDAYSHKAWYNVLSDSSNWDDEVWYWRPEKEEYPIPNDVGEPINGFSF